jgi:Uma2 family endonuclease
MNEIMRPSQFTPAGPPAPLPTTQAAEGTPRLRWTLEQFERLGDLGIWGEYDRVELIDGELVPMAPKGNRHENVRGKLQNWLMRRVPDAVLLLPELGWRPGGDHYIEPDILLCADREDFPTVPPQEVLLIVEVARTSLAYDTGLKAKTYAMLGVREYWVVNAVTLETTVFRETAEGGYARQMQLPATETVTPHLVPELALRPGELGF